ncbi:uncharacterized protein EDB91DRAFT_1246409 [Suillus paluster]|uniref:uncharacterized protein n=1 Tax=Suillus paluster TaxID=48578 RepID=UPI001B86EA45|nr:uncharacterized protein EDB91DRAFT_1246409 [Suillus paluster]KAG1745531.1 hypothetical protein EDB91DRAFT_1246409 [Suillus paluster]
MQSSNPIPSIFRSNGTRSSDPAQVPETSNYPSSAWESVPDVNVLDQYFSGDLVSVAMMQNSGNQPHVTDHTGYHSIPENALLFHPETEFNRQFCYPPDSWQIPPPPADDSLTHAYIWSHRSPVWINSGQLPQSLEAVESQPSTKLPVTTSPQARPTSHVCHWIENGVPCGQTISDVMRKLGAHLSDAHNVQGNEKKKIVCNWKDCGREMHRGGIRRHVYSRHFNIKSQCPNCLKEYSRSDAMKKHAKECQT